MATVPFKAGSSIYVAGPTNCGKTYWVYRLLASQYPMFDQPISSILYCYGVYQPLYDKIKKNVNTKKGIVFKEGLPTSNDLEKLNDGGFHVVVIDDLMEKVVKSLEMQELVLKYCHHNNITAILLSQNIFQPGRYGRTINLNMHNMVLFANKRDESQVYVLARQIFPKYWRSFVSVYRTVTKEPHSYILIDCTPSHPRIFQTRTHIFPPNDTCYVYEFCDT